jgi:hypothetical protein
MSPETCKAGLFQLSYIPMLTCGFASHHASWTVAQHSNSTIGAAQDWMAWALWYRHSRPRAIEAVSEFVRSG